MSMQRYVSDELTHFVGRSFRSQYNAHERQFELLVRILKSGRLGKNLDASVDFRQDKSFSHNEYYRSNVVCFSDIPVPDLGIHMGKFSCFGLAFHKLFLIGNGANPVYYVARNSRIQTLGGGMESQGQFFEEKHQKLWAFYHEFVKENPRDGGGDELGKPGVQVKEMFEFLVYHFFSFVKFYDEGLPPDDDRNYYMEREWRVFGNLDFGLEDVRRVIFPKRFARSFREQVPDYYGEITFS